MPLIVLSCINLFSWLTIFSCMNLFLWPVSACWLKLFLLFYTFICIFRLNLFTCFWLILKKETHTQSESPLTTNPSPKVNVTFPSIDFEMDTSQPTTTRSFISDSTTFKIIQYSKSMLRMHGFQHFYHRFWAQFSLHLPWLKSYIYSFTY